MNEKSPLTFAGGKVVNNIPVDKGIVPYLYRSGFMSLCAQDCQGNTLLHTSLQSGNQALSSIILNYMTEEADRSSVFKAINIQNCDGDTPLHVAARKYKQSKLLLDLVELGAKLGVPNKRNKVVDYDADNNNNNNYDETEDDDDETDNNVATDSSSLSSVSLVLLSPDWEKDIKAPTPSAPTPPPLVPVPDLVKKLNEPVSENKDKAPILPTGPVKDNKDGESATYSSTSSDSQLPEWLTIADKPDVPPVVSNSSSVGEDKDNPNPAPPTNSNLFL